MVLEEIMRECGIQGSSQWLESLLESIQRPGTFCQATAGTFRNDVAKTRTNQVTRQQKCELEKTCLGDVENDDHMVDREVLESLGREGRVL